MKVLLVCQDPRVTATVHAALLGADDMEIEQARTPQRALAWLDEGRLYDIVVADADTAPTGGFALSREIKAREHMGGDMPPVLLLLARDQDKWLANWFHADAYVRKPADPFDLAETVEAVAKGRPVPQLPGVGGGPVRLLDIPGPEHEPGQVAAEALPEDRDEREEERAAEAMEAGKRDLP